MAIARVAMIAGSVITTPAIGMGKCPDTSDSASVMADIERRVPCADARSHAEYVRAARAALVGALPRRCQKDFVRRFLRQSTCGRPGAVVCCRVPRKGNVANGVVESGRCVGGKVCSAESSVSVGVGCTSAGTCVTTTSTTVTTVSSVTVTTRPPHCDPAYVEPAAVDFTWEPPGGTCVTVEDGTGGVLATLPCGSIAAGGGASVIPVGTLAAGTVSQFVLNCCTEPCRLGPSLRIPAVPTSEPDCTDVGCSFGRPRPLPNPAVPALTVCTMEHWAEAPRGTLDPTTGDTTLDVALSSDVYLTGNVAQPCPRCDANGSPEAPATGTCDRGPRAGETCVTTSPEGLTRDCPTGGADATRPCFAGGGTCIDGTRVGAIAFGPATLTTGSTRLATAGELCPDQPEGADGCFGMPSCRAVATSGAPAGPVFGDATTPTALAAAFCLPSTGNGIVDGAASLPGPAALALHGTWRLSGTTTNAAQR